MVHEIDSGYVLGPFFQEYVGAATCSEGFVNCFLRVGLLGCNAAAMLPKQGELSENILVQNLRNKWPPHPVDDGI